MGWCSGTDLFDDTVDLALQYSSDLMMDDVKFKEFVKRLAELYYDKDWDCEGDSKYFKYLDIDWEE